MAWTEKTIVLFLLTLVWRDAALPRLVLFAAAAVDGVTSELQKRMTGKKQLIRFFEFHMIDM